MRTSRAPVVCQARTGEAGLEDLGAFVTERGYQILGILTIAAAINAINNPGKLASTFLKFKGTEFFNLAHGFCAAFAVVLGYFAFSVKGAAAKDDLDYRPIQRMASWMSLERIASLLVLLPLLRTEAALTKGGQVYAIALPLALTVLFVLAYKKLPLDLSVFKDTFSAVKATFNPANRVAACYSVVVVAVVGVVIGGLVKPALVGAYALTDYSGAKALADTLGDKDVLLVRLLACLGSYVAVSAYMLKEAAERGEMKEAVFRNLNLTLLAVSAVNSAASIVHASAKGQFPALSLLLSLYIAGLALHQYFYAK